MVNLQRLSKLENQRLIEKHTRKINIILIRYFKISIIIICLILILKKMKDYFISLS